MRAKLLNVTVIIVLAFRAQAAEHLASPQQPAHAAPQGPSTADNPDLTSKRQLLAERLAERGRLNGEIDQLREAMLAHEHLVVRLEWLLIDHNRLRQHGFDFEWAGAGGKNSGDFSEFLQGAESTQQVAAIAGALKRNDLAQVLSSPQLLTFSGRPTSMHVGRLVPVPSGDKDHPVKMEKTGVSVELTALDLGGDKVRVDLRYQLSDASDEQGLVFDDEVVPLIETKLIQTTIEVNYGETNAIGPICLRKQGGWPLPTSEILRTSDLLLITVEAVDGTHPSVRTTATEAPAATPSASSATPH